MKTATAAKWVERSPNNWGLYLIYPGCDLMAYRPRALVRQSAGLAGKWFWEHWPFMGQFGTTDTMEEALSIAGCPWRDIIQPAEQEAAP